MSASQISQELKSRALTIGTAAEYVNKNDASTNPKIKDLSNPKHKFKGIDVSDFTDPVGDTNRKFAHKSGADKAPTLAEVNARGGNDANSFYRTLTLTMMLSVLSDAESIENIFAAMSIFAYAGFNPEMTFNTLLFHAEVAKLTMAEFVRDIGQLIALYMARGTSIHDRLYTNTLSENAIKLIEGLINRYHILRNVGNAAPPSLITLGRIMNTFPAIVSAVLQSGNARPIGDAGFLPAGFMFPGGAALIPKDVMFNDLFERWVLWAISFDYIINRLKYAAMGAKAPTREQIDKNQRNYGEIARSQSVLSEDYKLAIVLSNTVDKAAFTYNGSRVTAFHIGKYVGQTP